MAYPNELALEQLTESTSNPRKVFHPDEITEIANSARALVNGIPRGILEPLIVRPKGKHFEIVAGAKRYRAAGQAQLATVPVRVMELDDEAALEIQLIENLQRSDPHPMEEAEGYHRLLKMDKGYTADTLAEKVGKDRSYIYKRLQFMELIPGAQEAFRENRINIGHALIICREPYDQQHLAFEHCFEEKWNGRKHVVDTKGKATETAKELNRWVHEHLHYDLAAAPWDKADPNLVKKAGPCTTCPKQTGANMALFSDLEGKAAQCLDGDCYEGKREAFVKLQVKAQPQLPRITLQSKYYVRGKLPAGTLTQYDGYQIVKPNGKCASAEPAIVAAGDKQLGLTILICRDKSCTTHAAKSSQRSASVPKSPAEARAAAKARLAEKIKVETQRAALRNIAACPAIPVKQAMEFLADRLIERVGNDVRRELCKVFNLEPTKKKQSWGAVTKDNEAPLLDAAKKHIHPLAFLIAVASCDPFYGRPYGGERGQGLKKACELAGVNLAKVQRSVADPLQKKADAARARKADKKPAKAKAAAK